ncbi:MAG: UDP-2,3-diacylglucosamine diphosphatase [Gammaproteobacteria bacterium]
MNNEILFISDIHLTLEKPDVTRRFLGFLEKRAVKAKALYILGDFFDAWIGDDDPTPPNNKVKAQLKKLTDAGIAVYLQLGNRDFLVGQRFCRETGIKMLDDYVVVDLFGEPTLLMHGDLLCTDDIAYQAFRKKSRSPEWQQDKLSKPLWMRLLVSRWYRFRSHLHKRKSYEILDVNQDCVRETMKKYNVLRLIHGHTHRPAIHDIEIDGRKGQRFVLPDWKHNSAGVLCWSKTGYRIEKV